MAIQEALVQQDGIYDYFLDETGDIKLVSGSEQIALLIKQRLQFIKGEWRFNILTGMPFDEIFTRPVYKLRIDSIMKTKILSTDGVESLVSYQSNIDPGKRTMEISFRYTDIYSSEQNLTLDIAG